VTADVYCGSKAEYRPEEGRRSVRHLEEDHDPGYRGRAIWFILVNTQRVSIYLWVPKVTAPLWLVLVITFAAGLIAGLLLQRRNRGRGQSTR